MTKPDIEQRIAQWEKMAHEAPDGMAYFSLGNAYKDAERNEDAARALRKAVELDPELSRAYQLLGQVLIKVGANDQAADVLTRGYEVSARRKDVMPQRAIGSLLEKLGKPVPRVAVEASAADAAAEGAEAGMVLDRRTGHAGPRMPDVPFRGPVGRFIFEHYSAPTWRQWIHQGTKVINELRLDFSRPDHQAMYDTHMMEWLGFTREEAEAWAAEHPQ